MDLNRLNYWLRDLVPAIYEIDGFLFIDRANKGANQIAIEAKKYASLKEAQSWMNIVLVDEFARALIDSPWEFADPAVDQLLDIFQQTWSCKINVGFPGARYIVERLKDQETEEFGLRLVNTCDD